MALYKFHALLLLFIIKLYLVQTQPSQGTLYIYTCSTYMSRSKITSFYFISCLISLVLFMKYGTSLGQEGCQEYLDLMAR